MPLLIFGTSTALRQQVGPPRSYISFYKAPFTYTYRGSRTVPRCAGDLIPPGRSMPQKYPSFFLRSIEALLSRSMSRPCRSEKRLLRNSQIMSSTLIAFDSIPPERG